MDAMGVGFSPHPFFRGTMRKGVGGMQLIIHDVEAITRQKLVYSSEIIEIAALRVEVTDTYGVRDTFHQYVQPQDVRSIPIATTRLTGISEQEMQRASGFVQVVREFQDWLGDDEYFLCSWSLSDRDFFMDDCIRHRLPTDWIRNYNDAQRWYSQHAGVTRRVSLANAMESLALPPDGQFHSALADTLCTWRVIQAICPTPAALKLEHNDCAGIPKTEIVYRDEAAKEVPDEDNPFFKLRGLR